MGWNFIPGDTQIVMFNGIMNAERYTKILEKSLVPFIKEHFAARHRLQQDNDPKHTSNRVKKFFAEKR